MDEKVNTPEVDGTTKLSENKEEFSSETNSIEAQVCNGTPLHSNPTFPASSQQEQCQQNGLGKCQSSPKAEGLGQAAGQSGSKQRRRFMMDGCDTKAAISLGGSPSNGNRTENENQSSASTLPRSSKRGFMMQELYSSSAMDMAVVQKLQELSDATGMPVKQESGQRSYGPPSDWKGPPPPKGCEVFVGKLPRQVFEPHLVPLFSKIGPIYELRMMIDFQGLNRGFCFIEFTQPAHAQTAIQTLNNYEVIPGRRIGVVKSVNNTRLFLGGIPPHLNETEIFTEIDKVCSNVVKVIICPPIHYQNRGRSRKQNHQEQGQLPARNRGYAFIEFSDHKSACMARRKMFPKTIHLWGKDIHVDWAVDGTEIRNLHVSNVSPKTTIETIKTLFNREGQDGVEAVNSFKSFTFVHFFTREQAIAAKNALDGMELDGQRILINWAKPSSKYIRGHDHNYGPMGKERYGNISVKFGNQASGNENIPGQFPYRMKNTGSNRLSVSDKGNNCKSASSPKNVQQQKQPLLPLPTPHLSPRSLIPNDLLYYSQNHGNDWNVQNIPYQNQQSGLIQFGDCQTYKADMLGDQRTYFAQDPNWPVPALHQAPNQNFVLPYGQGQGQGQSAPGPLEDLRGLCHMYGLGEPVFLPVCFPNVQGQQTLYGCSIYFSGDHTGEGKYFTKEYHRTEEEAKNAAAEGLCFELRRQMTLAQFTETQGMSRSMTPRGQGMNRGGNGHFFEAPAGPGRGQAAHQNHSAKAPLNTANGSLQDQGWRQMANRGHGGTAGLQGGSPRTENESHFSGNFTGGFKRGGGDGNRGRGRGGRFENQHFQGQGHGQGQWPNQNQNGGGSNANNLRGGRGGQLRGGIYRGPRGNMDFPGGNFRRN